MHNDLCNDWASLGAMACMRVDGMGSRGQVVGWQEGRSMDLSFLVKVEYKSDALFDDVIIVSLSGGEI